MNMKIYYNKDGWICNRYPYNLKIDNKENFIEVSEEEYQKTLCSGQHYAWAVKDGQLINLLYEEIPQEEIQNNLRKEREKICFSIINRGKLWYNKLTDTQLQELDKWYQDWLNVTETLEKPKTPNWVEKI